MHREFSSAEPLFKQNRGGSKVMRGSILSLYQPYHEGEETINREQTLPSLWLWIVMIFLKLIRSLFACPSVAPNFPYHNAEKLSNLKEKNYFGLAPPSRWRTPMLFKGQCTLGASQLAWPKCMQLDHFVLIEDWNFYSMFWTVS